MVKQLFRRNRPSVAVTGSRPKSFDRRTVDRVQGTWRGIQNHGGLDLVSGTIEARYSRR